MVTLLMEVIQMTTLHAMCYLQLQEKTSIFQTQTCPSRPPLILKYKLSAHL